MNKDTFNMKEKTELYKKICDRAEELGIDMTDRGSAIMDITSADLTFNLRLEDWLKADDFNFMHDFVGIRNNIVRDDYPASNFNFFIPRFSR